MLMNSGQIFVLAFYHGGYKKKKGTESNYISLAKWSYMTCIGFLKHWGQENNSHPSPHLIFDWLISLFWSLIHVDGLAQ